jgi:peptide-methionine (S)-S-oxide reductase
MSYTSSTARPSLRASAATLLAVAVATAFVWMNHGALAAESVARIAPPAVDERADPAVHKETVVFAGGCFWGVQGVFQHTKGVLQAVSGYAGGKADTASYMAVSTGLTGHAESVQVTFDPQQVSYGKLLQIYFSVAHDPTQLNRQGPDHGTQYRSEIFYTSASQKDVAEKYIAQLDAAHAYPGKIVTQVAPLAAFYPAEAYHQDYATRHPDADYIATFDLPKIASLKTLFADQYRDQPVLVASAAKSN